MEFSITLQNLDSHINSFSKDIRAYIQKTASNPKSLPTWAQIQKRETLYNGYREATLDDQEVGQLLARLGNIKISLAMLREYVVRDKSVPDSMRLTYRDTIERWQKAMADFQFTLTDLKQTCANTLRFYNSVQYILSSPNLGM